MFEEDEDIYDDYSEFEFFEDSVSESLKLIAWTMLLTLLAVGFVLAVALT